jgi:hypothetical protein
MRKTAFMSTAVAALVGLPLWALCDQDKTGAGDKAAVPRRVEIRVDKSESAEASDETDGAKSLEKQTYLGVALEPVPEALAAHLPDVLPKGQGLLVGHVMPDSPAAKAGLKLHDVLVSYDDQKVFSADQLVRLVRGDKPGHEATLGIVRAGKVDKVKVTLAEREVAVAEHGPSGGTGIRPHVGPLRLWLGDEPQIKAQPGGKPGVPGIHNRFLSMSLRSLDADRFKMEAEFKDDKGEAQKWSFEGTRNEIRKQVESDQDLPDNIRQQLLRSLQGPGGASRRPGGFRFMMPQGGIFFGGDGNDVNGFVFPDGKSVEEWFEQFSKDLDPQVRDQLKGAFRSIEPPGKRPVERDRSF